MKKILLSFSIVFISVGAAMAQGNTRSVTAGKTGQGTVAAAPEAQASDASSLKVDDMKFQAEVHEFGTVPEGPAAEYTFVFKNDGKQPIVLQNVHASCGCTTPSWSKEPVLPGQEGRVKASFSTQGRGGQPFTKTITVTSNAGTKVLTIKGNVEKAPDASVPENTSLIKTN